MKWSRKDKRLIEKEIKLYNKGIKMGFLDDELFNDYDEEEFPLYNCLTTLDCVFCKNFIHCEGCPNKQINKLIGVNEKLGCYGNRDYFENRFHFKTPGKEAQFRRLMWKRSLTLTKEAWLKIYKKEG